MNKYFFIMGFIRSFAATGAVSARTGYLKLLIFMIPLSAFLSCRNKTDIDYAREEILKTEKAFEEMASEKGLAEAFYYFADNNAVIKRGNDSLITGKENIRSYYINTSGPDVKLSWTPDFIDVSECGTLAYTYGTYLYTIGDSTGKTKESKGIFHTVWKKQNNEWRFVWD
jgi:ketosteroid isomerase-like protein